MYIARITLAYIATVPVCVHCEIHTSLSQLHFWKTFGTIPNLYSNAYWAPIRDYSCCQGLASYHSMRLSRGLTLFCAHLEPTGESGVEAPERINCMLSLRDYN